VLDYTIYWSNLDFPFYLIQQLSTAPQVSYQSVMIDDLNDYYLVIGPAFDVFIGLDSGMSINLMNIPTVLGIDQFLEVVKIIFITQNLPTSAVPYEVVLLDLEGLLKKYQFGSQQLVPMGQPCGITSITQSFTLINGYIFTNGSSLCFCDLNLNSCQFLATQQLPSVVSTNTDSLG
jgi:hypothetical protein